MHENGGAELSSLHKIKNFFPASKKQALFSPFYLSFLFKLIQYIVMCKKCMKNLILYFVWTRKRATKKAESLISLSVCVVVLCCADVF